MRIHNVRTLLTRTALFCGAVLSLTAVMISSHITPAKADIIVTPLPIAKADLIVSDVLPYYEFVYGQGWVRIDDKLWVQVYNNGNGSAGAFNMLFQWGQGYSYQQQYYGFAGLKAGASQWVVAESKAYNPYTKKIADYNLWASGAQFEIIVDIGNAVHEWDETNNVYQHSTP
jgi:hypothetical protein